MDVEIREYCEKYTEEAMMVWNEIVIEGNAFPQILPLSSVEETEDFFYSQSYTAVAVKDEEVVGLYILHPNNVGRCIHIANASYAVTFDSRGEGIGRMLVNHCLEKASELGFRVMQYNAVVASNLIALALYEDLGFEELGIIPGGFMRNDGTYEDIITLIKEL